MRCCCEYPPEIIEPMPLWFKIFYWTGIACMFLIVFGGIAYCEWNIRYGPGDIH